MKSHVQDGEVVGLQADPSKPVPFEVRAVRLLPMEVLTLNYVPCPISLSLTAWRTTCGFAQGFHGCVVSHPVCWGGSQPSVPSTLHPVAAGNMSPAGFCQAVPLESPPSWHQAGRILGEAGRAGCKPLGQHCHTMMPCWFWVSSKEGDILTKLCQDPFPDGGNWDYRGKSVNLAGAGLRALAAAVPFQANASLW